MSEISEVWVFMGASGRFPSGVFANRDVAAAWIQKNKLTGILTAYPINAGMYAWAISKGNFEPKNIMRLQQTLFRDSAVLLKNIIIFRMANQSNC